VLPKTTLHPSNDLLIVFGTLGLNEKLPRECLAEIDFISPGSSIKSGNFEDGLEAKIAIISTPNVTLTG
jgi:hypothetical protein